MASFKGNSSKIVSSSYLFTQLQNLYTKIKGLIDGKADKSHTHSYAGSSSAGGAATTALVCTGNSATATNSDMVDGEHSSAFVHTTGGNMTGEIQSTCPNNYRIVQGDYGFFIRNDSNATYFMLTNKGDPYGGWSDARPLYIDDATGICNINGNASNSDMVDGYHASDFIKTTGGTINGTLSMYGSNHIDVRHIDGSTSNSMDGNLYLNYNQPTHNVYFGNDGYGIYGNGSSYNGSADKVDGFHVILSNSRGLKPISAGTSAMTPNSSTLATGNIYLQYE